jgi:Protein of unknown function (DUF3050)
MFRRIVSELNTAPGANLGVFPYYLNRHIDLDDSDHGPMAERLVEDLCGDHPAQWQSAGETAVRTLEARRDLWDAIDLEYTRR